MDNSIKFDPKKLSKLNNRERLKTLNPDKIWAILGENSPEAILDIGAGTGLFAIEFTKLSTKGKFYACDNSDVMVEWMQQNIATERIAPLKSEENTIPLDNDFADLAYMMNLHHELFEPPKLLSEVYRILKPNAKIAIIDWKRGQTEQGPPDDIRVDEAVIIKQLQDAGFSASKSYSFLPLHTFVMAQKYTIAIDNSNCYV